MNEQLKERLAFEFEEGCKMTVDRVPGTRNDEYSIQATTTAAALKGIGHLIVELADMLEVPAHIVVCKLTTILFAENSPPA